MPVIHHDCDHAHNARFCLVFGIMPRELRAAPIRRVSARLSEAPPHRSPHGAARDGLHRPYIYASPRLGWMPASARDSCSGRRDCTDSRRSRCGWVLRIVGGEHPLWSAEPPRLSHEFRHLIQVDPAEPDQDRGGAVVTERDENVPGPALSSSSRSSRPAQRMKNASGSS